MANGEINIYEVEDALHPVSFNWSNGAATQNIDGLLTGWYKVTATDANGCIVEDSMFVAAEQTNCIYNIVTPNGDGYNDYLDLTDISNGLEMEAKIFNESGKLVATFNTQNPIWDAYSPSLPPTGSSSSYTVYITLKKDGVTIAQIGETISVIYSN
jgi:gliding motility-associated-like protein